MSEINEHIWVGSYGDSCDEIFLTGSMITNILSCADEFPVSTILPSYKVAIVDDVADEKTTTRFLEGAAKINEWINNNENAIILVHCFSGMSRSVSVVITYFMVYKGWSFEAALKHLKIHRRQTRIHLDFIPILKDIENDTR